MSNIQVEFSHRLSHGLPSMSCNVNSARFNHRAQINDWSTNTTPSMKFLMTRCVALETEWNWSSFWRTGLALTWMLNVKMVGNLKSDPNPGNIPRNATFFFRDHSAQWGSDKNSTVHWYCWSPPWFWGTPWCQVRVRLYSPCFLPSFMAFLFFSDSLGNSPLHNAVLYHPSTQALH